METFNQILHSLGLTLVHSLWQGALLAAAMLLLLIMIPRPDARCRYVFMFSGLLMLLLLFVGTFIHIHSRRLMPEALNAGQVFQLAGTMAGYPYITLSGAGTFLKWLTTWLNPYYGILAAGWLAGFILLGIRISGGLLVFKITLNKHLSLPAPSLMGICEKCLKVMHLNSKVRFRTVSRMIGPMVIGVFKPILVIPMAAVSGLSPEQIETVILHELAHIKRHDHFWLILQAFAMQVLFFHPLAWYLNREINRERENSCDDHVLKMKINPITYIKALTMIHELNIQSFAAANALKGRSNNLLARVKRLLTPEIRHTPFFRLAIMLLLVAVLGLTTMAFVRSGKGPEKPKTMNTAAMKVMPLMQPDSAVARNATVETMKDRKKIKIILEGDTIKEMTINGRQADKEEMRRYAGELGKMQHELQLSEMELKRAQEELQKSQQELEIARRSIEGIDKEWHGSDLSNVDRQLREAWPQDYAHAEAWRNLINDERFREEMREAREAGREAMEEFRKQQQEYWLQHQDEFRKQHQEYWLQHQDEFREAMEKARQEARKTFEKMKKNDAFRFYFQEEWPIPLPPAPPAIPETELPPLPGT
ncbi:MAG: M48 family metalloprotease, partial [Bacteroidales bacterium]|nr:M48 family metalloprotease [Bacteroidales bacterium]